MKFLFRQLEKIFFTNIIGEIDLYTIVSTALKYVFVFIVLYFIYAIVKMIFFDIKSIYREESSERPFLNLVNGDYSLEKDISETIILDSVNTIGRDRENTIIINDGYISKRHAIIMQKEDGFYLEDLNSSNGTFLNDKKIEDSVKLLEGDVISFGELSYKYNGGDFHA